MGIFYVVTVRLTSTSIEATMSEEIEELKQQVIALETVVFTLAGWLIGEIGQNGYTQLWDTYEEESNKKPVDQGG